MSPRPSPEVYQRQTKFGGFLQLREKGASRILYLVLVYIKFTD